MVYFALQAAYEETEPFRYVKEFETRMEHESRDLHLAADAKADKADEGADMTTLADRILEGISLLEAVTVSPVFVCVICSYDGVPALLRALGAVSVVRMLAQRPAARE